MKKLKRIGLVATLVAVLGGALFIYNTHPVFAGAGRDNDPPPGMYIQILK